MKIVYIDKNLSQIGKDNYQTRLKAGRVPSHEQRVAWGRRGGLQKGLNAQSQSAT